ncbi:ligand-binding sensor domain-containing protein, partial [Lutimonas sp.]|uniref:ligand-binding sensor domain-containing protein n=1 Tax=Lutimonas sp. TaxID=1872403 RepID=UPI003D9BD897
MKSTTRNLKQLVMLPMLLICVAVSFSFSNNLHKDLFATHDVSHHNVKQDSVGLPVYGNWKNFSTKNGLPSNKVYCVRIDGKRVLIGSHDGLSVYENNEWTTYTTEDGLAHNGVLAIDISEQTGDAWIGTMGGLSRWSAGKFENFNQMNSGMPNDLIYAVTCDEKDIWVATGGGAGRYDTYRKEWQIFTEQNAPMHEPWTYGVSSGDGKIFIAAWGGGVVEYTKETEQFRDYTDPDGNMEIDLFPDDGIVHDITTGTSWADGKLWVGTYFGLSRYDGVRWKGYFDHDSGLASNFINFIKASGKYVFIATDRGLSCTDGEQWITYVKNEKNRNGKAMISKGAEVNNLLMTPSIAHNYVLGVDIKDEVIWVATSDGLSRGELINSSDKRLVTIK